MGEIFFEQLEELLSVLSTVKKRCERMDRKHQNLQARIAFVQENEGIYDEINGHFASLWDTVTRCRSADERSLFRRTIQDRLRPFICVGGLNDMVFYKPAGHAGDFLTIYNYFLEYSGTATYEILISQYSRSIPVAVAHRNRISFLLNEFEGLADSGAKIMAIGCGPAIEVLRASCEPYFDSIHYSLYDPDEGATEFVRKMLPARQNVTYYSYSLLHLLKSLLTGKLEDGQKDLIYCCGLYDYLEDRLAGKLMQAMARNLKPDGKLIITNVSTSVTERAYFEFFAGWELILRSESDMEALAAAYLPELDCTVHRDPVNGANVYLTVNKRSLPNTAGRKEESLAQIA